MKNLELMNLFLRTWNGNVDLDGVDLVPTNLVISVSGVLESGSEYIKELL